MINIFREYFFKTLDRDWEWRWLEQDDENLPAKFNGDIENEDYFGNLG